MYVLSQHFHDLSNKKVRFAFLKNGTNLGDIVEELNISDATNGVVDFPITAPIDIQLKKGLLQKRWLRRQFDPRFKNVWQGMMESETIGTEIILSLR